MDTDGVLVRDPLAVTEAVFDPVDVCETTKAKWKKSGRMFVWTGQWALHLHGVRKKPEHSWCAEPRNCAAALPSSNAKESSAPTRVDGLKHVPS